MSPPQDNDFPVTLIKTRPMDSFTPEELPYVVQVTCDPKVNRHVLTELKLGEAEFCDCGSVRNPEHKANRKSGQKAKRFSGRKSKPGRFSGRFSGRDAQDFWLELDLMWQMLGYALLFSLGIVGLTYVGYLMWNLLGLWLIPFWVVSLFVMGLYMEGTE